ncbi:PVC-type heme-binding CxxCH protein [Humisphaera borealis]|uniref:HEAT repeat domain-containing protein n=1 Tax=Humisphaera borealis TaxID=2807512 RepID=A0A7M2WWS7_9BACT|nr:PVC-type heme-binding CxxCH protein [Humisphaera borealis]QOV89988.1 HEAT repeat domain-containing protein [Humisphaera borealis]
MTARYRTARILTIALAAGGVIAVAALAPAQNRPARPQPKPAAPVPDVSPDGVDYTQYGIYEKSAARPGPATPVETSLPLKLNKGDRIAFIGNGLLEFERQYGYIETLLQQRFPQLELRFRNLCWPADTADLQPRPENFADSEQHLAHEKADVIFAAFGYNESFKGEAGEADFRKTLGAYVSGLKSRAFNRKTGPRIVLLSPIAAENISNVPAADLNNANLKRYADIVREVAKEQKVAFLDLYTPTVPVMADPKTDLTFNGVHLTDPGYALLGKTIFSQLTGEAPPAINESIRSVVTDKDRQYERRFRPLNSFYYTGSRNKDYGYLDFLPAMRNFDAMVANRESRIWALAAGKDVPPIAAADAAIPPMPAAKQSRGVNEWLKADEELKAFKIDPRFDVSLFAGEDHFPDAAKPIQMRWDSRGRLWVSCSTTYPHVYPGREPNDKIVVLEDTDKDGRADKSTVFAEKLHIPLSFELGDGGVYVSEQPHLTFLKDTDGDGKADLRRIILTGFGTEDSHHALHDFVWTPDGDLLFRESIFHHSQVETAYGPVRMQNSGWFRYDPRTQRLTAFGTYPSTNPWGVTFDDWGQHVASHPIYAAAFHSLNPPYPLQHASPRGLQAYSGTCGHEFVDFATFPDEMRGGFIKARYKPTNRLEYHQWVEGDFGFEEKYVSDLIFSTNLSFIPVDLGFGPEGAMYICDWYNPVKGHAQYALRDERRDRTSGRIWRMTAKGRPLQTAPKIDGASTPELLELLKRPEYRYRYWAKRELRERNAADVKSAVDAWSAALEKADPRYRHHQIEAVWMYRGIGATNAPLLRDLLACQDHHARAAAVQQLRYWHSAMPDAITLLKSAANDANGIVRMEAAIAASYIGTREALDAMLDIAKLPRGGALDYAFVSSLGSEALKRHWESNAAYARVQDLVKPQPQASEFAEGKRTPEQVAFDKQADLSVVRIGCVPERMRFTVEQLIVKPGQPVKIVFTNGDATDHNLVLVKPDAMEEVGMAANDMAKDPANASSDFIPAGKKNLILQATPLVGPSKKSRIHVLRFKAPAEPGIYPYVCTYPGHWVMMNGLLVVANDPTQAATLLAARKAPTQTTDWTIATLAADADATSAKAAARDPVKGMRAYMKAQCNVCHPIGGHGVAIGPDLSKVAERYKGQKLLSQILDPSAEVNENYRLWTISLKDGDVLAGSIVKSDAGGIDLVQNPLAPQTVTRVAAKDILKQTPSKQSAMPQGLLSPLTKEEIMDLLAFLETGGTGGGSHNH